MLKGAIPATLQNSSAGCGAVYQIRLI